MHTNTNTHSCSLSRARACVRTRTHTHTLANAQVSCRVVSCGCAWAAESRRQVTAPANATARSRVPNLPRSSVVSERPDFPRWRCQEAGATSTLTLIDVWWACMLEERASGEATQGSGVVGSRGSGRTRADGRRRAVDAPPLRQDVCTSTTTLEPPAICFFLNP